MKPKDESYQKLMTKVNLFESTHEKITLRWKFNWFDYFVTDFLQNFADLYDLHYEFEKSSNDITVFFIGKPPLLFNNDAQMKKLLRHTDVCSITTMQDCTRIELWFRCWKWVKKNSLSHIMYKYISSNH